MSIPVTQTVEFHSRSADETRRIGFQLGGLLQPGDVICLQGGLGAGKTTFAQGLAKGWGSLDDVSSPTFIIVNQYHNAKNQTLFHLDTYRLETIPEAEELDLETMLAEGALLIEWPERLGNLIPPERLWITFTHIADEQRNLRIQAVGSRAADLSRQIAEAA